MSTAEPMTRHRSWVLASLSKRCEVCKGHRAVLLWPVGAPEIAGPHTCPHCTPPQLPIALDATKENV